MRARLSIASAVAVALIFLLLLAGSLSSSKDGSVTAGPGSSETTKSLVKPAASTISSSSAPARPYRPAETTKSDRSVTVALSSLPPEAARTWALIEDDGPFPYDKDGTTFQNREQILPRQKRGYYREYTVPTPGEDDRGARRLVVGQNDEVFYTGDHYASFVTVDVTR